MANSKQILSKLLKSLSEISYTATTQEEKQKAAEARYASQYDEKSLAARQSYAAQDAAYAREQAQLAESYAAQRADSAASYREAYAAQDRNALKKGMQRSSYNGQTLAGISTAGAAAQQALAKEEQAQNSALSEKRSLAATELAQKLEQYASSQQSDVQAYVDQLTAQEETARQTAQQNYQSLLSQIYSLTRARETDKQAQKRWKAELKAKYGKS